MRLVLVCDPSKKCGIALAGVTASRQAAGSTCRFDDCFEWDTILLTAA